MRATGLLENLWFVVNHAKLILTPMIEVEFLGFTLNSETMKLKLPGNKIRAEPRKLHLADSPNAQCLYKLLSKLNVASRVIQPAPLFLGTCRWCCGQETRTMPAKVTLSPEMREELEWWEDHLPQWTDQSMVVRRPTLKIESDASRRGW